MNGVIAHMHITLQVAINVLGWGVVGSAIAHVSRKVCLFILTYGYLWWLFKKEARDQAKDQLWAATVRLQLSVPCVP